jgi:hypothetical protein
MEKLSKKKNYFGDQRALPRQGLERDLYPLVNKRS